MELNTTHDGLMPRPLSTSLVARSALVIFCLAAGLGYRVIVGVFAPSILQLGVLAALAAILLALALLARNSSTLSAYREIPFAFFIFTVAGILGDASSFASLQQAFVLHVLHEAPSANNPIAGTVAGSVLGQLVGTLALVLPIVLLTLASGRDLQSIYLDQTRNRWVLLLGVAGFVLFYYLAARGFSARFFPNNGLTLPQFFALTPALIVLVLCNGLREELWFRGLFLKKYGQFLGPLAANVLSALIFASFHVAVTYSRSLPLFLGIALVQGLILGYMMQKSNSILAPVIFHAATDIPIFLVYLSYAR
jgi:membrane protease YdiL (CAAX protease family)